MRKLAAWIITGMLFIAMMLACGEKPCNKEGSVKAEKGILYYCTDRGNGGGLKWYESGSTR